MNTRRTPARRVKDSDVHKEIPPQVEEVEQVPQGALGDQIPIVGGGDDPQKLSDMNIKEALLGLA